MSNCVTKSDSKSAAGVDTSKFVSLKLNIYKADINKLKNFPFDLYKLSNVVEKEVLQKDVYDELVKNLMPLIPEGLF